MYADCSSSPKIIGTDPFFLLFRWVLDWPWPGLHSGCHQGLLQHGHRRDLHNTNSAWGCQEELVHEQEHQGEEARLVRRGYEWRLPGETLCCKEPSLTTWIFLWIFSLTFHQTAFSVPLFLPALFYPLLPNSIFPLGNLASNSFSSFLPSSITAARVLCQRMSTFSWPSCVSCLLRHPRTSPIIARTALPTWTLLLATSRSPSFSRAPMRLRSELRATAVSPTVSWKMDARWETLSFSFLVLQ